MYYLLLLLKNMYKIRQNVYNQRPLYQGGGGDFCIYHHTYITKFRL